MANEMSEEQREEMSLLAQKLATNPKTRKGFLRLIKTADPESVIPELDAAAEVEARFDTAIKTEREAREALETRIQDTRLEDEVLTHRRKLADSGFSEDEIKGVEESMTEMQKNHEVVGYETAARLYRQDHQSAEPSGDTVTRFKVPDTKGILENPTQWALNEADAFLKERLHPRSYI